MLRLAFGTGLRLNVRKKFKARFGIQTVAEFYGATEGVAGSFSVNGNDFGNVAIGRSGVINEFLLCDFQAIVKIDREAEAAWRDPETGSCIRIPRGLTGELLFKLAKEVTAKPFYGYLNGSEACKAKAMHNVLATGSAYFR